MGKNIVVMKQSFAVNAFSEAVVRRYSLGKFHKFHRKTSVYQEQTRTQVFFCQICEIFNNIYFYRTPTVTTSETEYVYASAVDLLHIRIESK